MGVSQVDHTTSATQAPRHGRVSHLPARQPGLSGMSWVEATTGIHYTAGYPRLRSTEDGRRPSAYLLSQPTYNRRVRYKYTLAHRPTSTGSSWHVKYALASLHETG